MIEGMKKPHRLYKNSSVLLQDVDVLELPSTIEIDGQTLYIKDEFHITLLGARYLAEWIDPANVETLTGELLQEFDEFVSTNTLENYEINSELRLVKENDQKTIIVLASVQNLDRLFDQLNQKFSMDLPRQISHVTLYRYPKDFVGIPIPSREIFERISEPVSIPSLGM
jgi:hypothetical protein